MQLLETFALGNEINDGYQLCACAGFAILGKRHIIRVFVALLVMRGTLIFSYAVSMSANLKGMGGMYPPQ